MYVSVKHFTVYFAFAVGKSVQSKTVSNNSLLFSLGTHGRIDLSPRRYRSADNRFRLQVNAMISIGCVYLLPVYGHVAMDVGQ